MYWRNVWTCFVDFNSKRDYGCVKNSVNGKWSRLCDGMGGRGVWQEGGVTEACW